MSNPFFAQQRMAHGFQFFRAPEFWHRSSSLGPGLWGPRGLGLTHGDAGRYSVGPAIQARVEAAAAHGAHRVQATLDGPFRRPL